MQVKSLETKLDHVVSLLEDSKRRCTTSTLCEEQQCCCVCRHNYDSRHPIERRSSDELQSKENISEKPARRRKVGISNPNLDTACLSEREEPVEERGSLKSGQSLNNNNYVRNSMKIEPDGCHFLSPGFGYNDGDSLLSRHSSTYGISDNCPSPNPSTGSSEDSYHSRDNIHHHGQSMLPNDIMVPPYGDSCQSRDNIAYHDYQVPSDGRPLFTHRAPVHSTCLEIPVHNFTPPQHELYGRQDLYGAFSDSFMAQQFGGSTGDHSTDLPTATLPQPQSTNQLSGRRIHGQSPLDCDHNQSTVMAPPPSSPSSQYGDHDNSGNCSSQHKVPGLCVSPNFDVDEDVSVPVHNDNNPSLDLMACGQLDNYNMPKQKAFSEERPALETGSRFHESSLGMPLSPEDQASDVGLMEDSLQTPRDCYLPDELGTSGDNSQDPRPEMCLEDNPLNSEYQAHGNSQQFVKEDRISDGSTSKDGWSTHEKQHDGTYAERLEEDKCHSSFPYSCDENAGTESIRLSMEPDRNVSGGYSHGISPKSSDSEDSDMNMVDRSHDVAVVTPGPGNVQETRM